TCLDVVGVDVDVMQVERVLPHVQHEQRGGANGDVALLIVELLDDEVATDGLVRQEGPTGTLQTQCGSRELGTESVKRTESVLDGGCEFALRLVAAVRGDVVPEHGVVDVSAGVEREVLGEAVDVGEVTRFAGFSELLEGVVGACNVGSVVLAVMQLHDLRRNVRLKSCVVVAELGQNVLCHEILQCNGPKSGLVTLVVFIRPAGQPEILGEEACSCHQREQPAATSQYFLHTFSILWAGTTRPSFPESHLLPYPEFRDPGRVCRPSRANDGSGRQWRPWSWGDRQGGPVRPGLPACGRPGVPLRTSGDPEHRRPGFQARGPPWRRPLRQPAPSGAEW